MSPTANEDTVNVIVANFSYKAREIGEKGKREKKIEEETRDILHKTKLTIALAALS